MLRIIIVSLTLLSIWFGLSGYYDIFFVTVGIAITIPCVLVVEKMRVIKGAQDFEGIEGASYSVLNFALYIPWLLKEIVKSAWEVTLVIIDPTLPISPTIKKIKAGQKTPIGIFTYANSITLTPGTLTISVLGQGIVIHSLLREGVEGLEQGIMDKKVTSIESNG